MIRPPALVSVVMPALNMEAVISGQLDGLARQDYGGPWELVVADNGSTDRTRAIVNGWVDRIPGVRVVDAAQRRTVSHARNEGIRAARGELILLCDADDVVSSGWLRAMVDAARSFDAVGGRLDLDLLNPSRVVGERPTMFQVGLETIGDFLPYAVGANCGFSRELFDAVGGFDVAYVEGGDDIDFFWRAQLAGYTLGFAPSADVAYRYRPGGRACWRQFLRYGRADPQLYRAFRTAGMPRSSVVGALTRGGLLALRSPLQLAARTRSADWTWKMAWRVGRLVGSVKHRVLYL